MDLARLRWLPLLLALSSPAFSAELSCRGPFARGATHASLAAAFGADHVTFERIDGPEGSELDATIVFRDDPRRRVEILWHDEARRARPRAVMPGPASDWTGPRGLRTGMSLAEVERRNGAPLRIGGFNRDDAGLAEPRSGPLARLPGGCALSLRFEPTVALPLGPRFRPIMGDRLIPSTHPLIREARLKLVEIALTYPRR